MSEPKTVDELNDAMQAAERPRRALSPAARALMLSAIVLGGGASGPMRSTREERELRRSSNRGTSQMQDERIAAAQLKRKRKADRRRPG